MSAPSRRQSLLLRANGKAAAIWIAQPPISVSTQQNKVDSQCQCKQCHCQTRQDLAWIKQHPESMHSFSPLRCYEMVFRPFAVNKADALVLRTRASTRRANNAQRSRCPRSRSVHGHMPNGILELHFQTNYSWLIPPMYVCFLLLSPNRTEVFSGDAFLDQCVTRECRIHPSRPDQIDPAQNCSAVKPAEWGN